MSGAPRGRDVLLLSCWGCGSCFRSALDLDEESFETLQFDLTIECCRVCGHIAPYQKSDYFFPPTRRGAFMRRTPALGRPLSEDDYSRFRARRGPCG